MFNQSGHQRPNLCVIAYEIYRCHILSPYFSNIYSKKNLCLVTCLYMFLSIYCNATLQCVCVFNCVLLNRWKREFYASFDLAVSGGSQVVFVSRIWCFVPYCRFHVYNHMPVRYVSVPLGLSFCLCLWSFDTFCNFSWLSDDLSVVIVYYT